MISHQFLTELERLFRLYGNRSYGEHCTQYEHMAQCGWWAQQQGGSNALIGAAFLHDVGHLLAEDRDLPGRDQWGYIHHDSLAESWLREHGLPESLVRPIGMHVQAKRYLVATRPEYAKGLSVASKATLSQQGGPFTEEQCREFEADPAFHDAIRLRELDELGKAEEFELPPLKKWVSWLERHFSYQAQ
ncbi:HD domain-containing protein [Hahella aquimaris]|uniref:phosphonate degradation HD-domain oxygenase n=1 Tax=Hahella sp. HNIBRBA332 TaxID=3015983 RepID=UPI00273C3325|nr:phosphonate degradation HD-domain oxygenase [Hahella sp. HNIBRBA332]WLQ16473.1 HD domain-containing protein [Hahella sp. HNIBRBA332]